MIERILQIIHEETWAKVLLIVTLTFICYMYALQCGYIWDDDYLVTENPYLRTPTGLSKLWFDFRSRSQYYPAVFTVFWVFYKFWGLNPVGYHFANILLHIFNALLVWKILSRFNVKGAFWAGLIFAVHPVHVESVAWISELKNTLSGFFFLSALLVYFKLYTPDWKIVSAPKVYAGMLGLYLLGLFSKTIVCALPVVILLLLWWKKSKLEKRDIISVLPLFAFGFIMGLVTVWMEVHQVGASGSDWQHTFIEKCLIAGRVPWFYLWKLILPVQLIFTYPRWTIDAGVWWQYLFPAALAASLGALWHMSKRWGKGFLVALLYFIIVLFPALGFFNLYPMRFSYVADHFQYLASTGPIAMGVGLLAWVWERSTHRWRNRLSIGFALVISCFCLLSLNQTLSYKDRVTLFTDVIRKNPDSWMAYNNRGDVFFEEGRYALAEPDFKRALELKPDYAEAVTNMGLIFYFKQQEDKAFEFYSRAIALDPMFSPAYANRGIIFRNRKEFDEAEQDFTKAIELNPTFIAAYNRRAVLYSMQGDQEKALKDLTHLLKIDPKFAAGYANRAIVLVKGNNYASALSDLNYALRLDPNLGNAYLTRADVFIHFEEWDRAWQDLMRAQSLGMRIDPSKIQQVRSQLEGLSQ